MRRIRSRQLINLMLVLSLCIAPFQVLFANAHMSHETKISQADVVEMTMMMAEGEHMSGATDSHHNLSSLGDSGGKDCEKTCNHCVFFSAAVFSLPCLNNKVLSIYNPHISNFPSGVVTDVDVRPPKIL
ncbi:MAG: hypothetical protein OEM38_05105 [Gammaproteobacteria bacterium]|nr:hypothetical protein [Gammaproteobacteria bacterium]